MEKAMNFLKRNERLSIYFPPDEIENWKKLKFRFNTLGYRWVDFSADHNYRSAVRSDQKNLRDYNKRKSHENKMRTRFRGPGNIPSVQEPPQPSNADRYLMLEKWSKYDAYNISMISVYLYSKHGLSPCKDYDPTEIFDVYNKYCLREPVISIPENRSVRFYENHRVPSLPKPPPRNLLPDINLRRAQSAPSAPPSYDDSFI